MARKKMVQETVFNGGQYESDGWPPEDAPGFIAWFQERIDRIPVEHRAAANISLESEGGYYGEHHAHIEITYLRPETDDQFAARLEREKRESLRNAAEQERRERQMLAWRCLKHTLKLRSQLRGSFAMTACRYSACDHARAAISMWGPSPHLSEVEGTSTPQGSRLIHGLGTHETPSSWFEINFNLPCAWLDY